METRVCVGCKWGDTFMHLFRECHELRPPLCCVIWCLYGLPTLGASVTVEDVRTGFFRSVAPLFLFFCLGAGSLLGVTGEHAAAIGFQFSCLPGLWAWQLCRWVVGVGRRFTGEFVAEPPLFRVGLSQ